jgi:DNA mismatch repair protein MutS2
LLIGNIGLSNALKIARQLRLPEHVVARAEAYLAQSRSGGSHDWEVLLRLRKEAEEAREAAMVAHAEAERTREALAERMAELQKESQKADTIADARARLQPGDRVVVPRLGYDRPGRLVKLDPRKKSAVVAIGHVTWNVAIDELIPQVTRMPSQDSSPGSKSPVAKRAAMPEVGDDE